MEVVGSNLLKTFVLRINLTHLTLASMKPLRFRAIIVDVLMAVKIFIWHRHLFISWIRYEAKENTLNFTFFRTTCRSAFCNANQEQSPSCWILPTGRNQLPTGTVKTVYRRAKIAGKYTACTKGGD